MYYGILLSYDCKIQSIRSGKLGFFNAKKRPAGNQRTKRVKYPEWINFADIGYSETVEEQD